MKKSKSIGISLLWVLLFFGVQIILSLAVSFGSMSTGGAPTDNMSVTLLMSNAVTAALVLLITKLHGDRFSSALGMKKLSFAGIAVPFLFAAALAPVVSFVMERIPFPEWMVSFNDTLMELAVTDDDPLTVTAIVLFGPVCEELVFRGAIFSTLKKSFSVTGAVLISAFLFGFVHLNPIQSLYAFCIGMIFCLIRLRFDSLWACIVCHAAFNLTGGFLDITRYAEKTQMILLAVCAVTVLALSVWMAMTYKKRKR